MATLTHSTLVPLVSQAGKEETLSKFLIDGLAHVNNEPATHQWYASKVIDSSPVEYSIFDTFPDAQGRTDHFNGPIPKAIGEKAPSLLQGGPTPEQILTEILAHKVTKAGSDSKAGLTTGLRVIFTAKPEKKDFVRGFLTKAVSYVDAEPETIAWYAVHWPGTDKFGIVDFFSTDEAREAHLQGELAKALLGSVDALLTGPPEIVKLEVLAAKVEGV